MKARFFHTPWFKAQGPTSPQAFDARTTGPKTLNKQANYLLVVFLAVLASYPTTGIHAQDTLDVVKSFQFIGPDNQAYLDQTDGLRFGSDVEGIGDLNGDGVNDIAVGRHEYPSGYGSVFIMFLDTNGSVLSHTHITNNVLGMPDSLDIGDAFGVRLSNLGDLDGDGHTDLAVLATGDDDGYDSRGAVHILFLDSTGHVKAHQKISDTAGGFTGAMTSNRDFGAAIAEVGDLNNDGIQDLVVGATNANGGGASSRGAIWILYLNTDGTVASHKLIDASSAWPGGNPLTTNSYFGYSAAKIGDLNNDGNIDLAVTAQYDGTGLAGKARGRVYILFLDSSQNILSYSKLSAVEGGIQTPLSCCGGHFGWSIDNVGDLNADGTIDLLVGARQQDVSHNDDGAALILYMNPDGTVQHDEIISDVAGTGGQTLGLNDNAWLGFAVANIGDIDGDKVTDIAISANGHDGGGSNRGRVYLMNLNPKPMIVDYSVVDPSDSTVGMIDLSITGGVRPYSVMQSPVFLTASEFEVMKDSLLALDTTGIGGLDLGLESLSLDDLANAFDADLDSLKADAYPILVRDQQDNRWFKYLAISETMVEDVAVGVTLSNNNHSVERTSLGGAMELTLQNFLFSSQKGYLCFSVSQASDLIAVGMREHGAAQLNFYEQMEFAVILKPGSQVDMYYNKQIHTTTLSYKKNDSFILGFDDGYLSLIMNDTIVYSDSVFLPYPMNLQGDVYIKNTGNKVTDLCGSSKAFWACNGVVTHGDCNGLEPSIDLSIVNGNQTYGPFTYAWSGPSGYTATTQDIQQLEPGRYTVVVTATGLPPTSTETKSFWVGYEVEWDQLSNATVDPLSPNTVSHAGAPFFGGGQSANQLLTPTQPWWIQFEYSPQSPVSFYSPEVFAVGTKDLLSPSWEGGVGVVSYQFPPPFYWNFTFGIPFSNTAPPAPAFWMLPAGDVVMEYDIPPPTDMVVMQNGLLSASLPSFINPAAQFQNIRSAILSQNTTIYNVVCSFKCGVEPRALLVDDLDGGYHRAARKMLKIGYHEEYNDQSLEYTIRNMMGAEVITSATQPKSIEYGYNEIDIDLLVSGIEMDEGFYWLEIKNSKGINRYLRFHYDNSIQ